MKRMTAYMTAALISAGMMSAPAFAADAPAQGQSTAQAAQAQAGDFTDAQLQQFAAASQDIARISQEFAGKLQKADDETAKQSVRQEANDEMVSAVEDSGLEVATFNSIGQAVQNDPDLMKKVQKLAQENS
ncbi:MULTISPECIES: DUF4168 domain-containing protein [unclassified Cobetia]|uniref:DUF4168 domain-containing protein n=1 Tax=unclassified Cobetia TaxID=2609414 RepID=UPI0020984183|nr:MULTISPECIES: DUF4168 domain-containing protein [unclassified Cobetia]MCO7232583.1 DUF4168 domain-containing protein [Cobetia sp. Dlab-2-AX]MCO7235857.1 DUF4168 domain-containing protein [Cobetia sp. Dlab-2-U]